MNIVHYSKSLILRALGGSYVFYNFLRYAPYDAKQNIKRLFNLKKTTLLGKAISAYLSNDIKNYKNELSAEINFVNQHANKDRIPEETYKFSVDKYCVKGIENRGSIETDSALIMSYIYQYLDNVHSYKVLEVGCGNSAISISLAEKYPQHQFIAMDLEISQELSELQLTNLYFHKAYVVDDLGEEFDLVFGSSVFKFMLPKELERFLGKVKSVTRFLIISELSWANYATFNEEFYSAHLEGYVWHHNYKQYCHKLGLNIIEAHEFPCTGLTAMRKDVIQRVYIIDTKDGDK